MRTRQAGEVVHSVAVEHPEQGAVNPFVLAVRDVHHDQHDDWGTRVNLGVIVKEERFAYRTCC